MLSLAHLTIIDADPLELIEAAQAGGFDAVGLRLVSPAHTPMKVDLLDNAPWIRSIRERSAQTGVSVLDVEAFSLTPDTDFEVFKRAFDNAGELGARYLLASGHDTDESRLAANLARLAEAASAYGIRVGLEFIPYVHVARLEDALRILAAAAHPNAGLLVDALHLSRSGGSPADLQTVPPESFSYAHLCDADASLPPTFDQLPAEARTGRFYPGEGGLWLDDFVKALPADLPLAVEAPSRRHAHLPVVERGRIAGAAARAFLARRKPVPDAAIG